MANIGELQNIENESVSGSFKIRINGEDVGRLEEYYSKSEKKDVIIFNNLFAITPKEKFRLRITSNASKEYLNFQLIYCGGHDITCSIGMKIQSFDNFFENYCLKSETIDVLDKDEFLILSKRCSYSKHHDGELFWPIHRDGCMVVDLTITARKMDNFGSFLEPQTSLKDKDLQKNLKMLESIDVYHIICFDENGKKQKLSCPKYVVARYGECLVRHFENALNAEKPLVIKDFSAKTVKNFFFCLENQVLNYSGVTLDLAKMAHLYNVPSLFKACENFLAETLEMNTEEFVENVETWIQFANTYNSVIFTSLISSFAERRAKNNTLPANWHTIIENNQNFAQLVGKVRLGLSIPPPAKYVVKKSESIYLVCDDI